MHVKDGDRDLLLVEIDETLVDEDHVCKGVVSSGLRGRKKGSRVRR